MWATRRFCWYKAAPSFSLSLPIAAITTTGRFQLRGPSASGRVSGAPGITPVSIFAAAKPFAHQP